jgi:hypothetical protein
VPASTLAGQPSQVRPVTYSQLFYVCQTMVLVSPRWIWRATYHLGNDLEETNSSDSQAVASVLLKRGQGTLAAKRAKTKPNLPDEF